MLYHLAVAICVFMISIPCQVNAEENPAAPEYELGEISVTATRTRESVGNVPADVEVITAEEIKRENIQNLDQALRHVTGVFARRTKGIADTPTTANVSLRGFPDAKRTLVLIDGQPLNTAYVGNVEWGSLPIENVERIEVVKGPCSSLYGGNAMGGVINIITKTPQQRSITIKGGAGTEDTTVYGVNYGDRFFDRLSVSLGFENRETGGYVNDFYVKDADPTTSGSGTPVIGWEKTENKFGEDAYIFGDKGRNWGKARNYSAKLGFDITPKQMVSMSVTEGTHEYGHADGKSYLEDKNGNPINSGKVDIGGKVYSIYPYYFQGIYGERTTDVYTLRYEAEITDWLTLKANAGLTDQRKNWYVSPKSGASGYGSQGGNLDDAPSQDWLYGLQTDIALGEKNLLTLGMEYRTDEAEKGTWRLDDWKDETDKGQKTYEARGKDEIISAFFQDRHEFPGDVTLYAGLRYDYWKTSGGKMWDAKDITKSDDDVRQKYDSRTQDYFSPKVALHYRADDNLSLRASAGYAFRWPNIYELYCPWYYYKYETRSNPELDPETTKSWEIGADSTLNDGWTVLRTTYFENYVEDLIYNASDPSNPYIKTQENAGKAKIRGIEMGLEQKITSWLDAFVNLTYTDARITKNKAKPDSEGKQITYVPRETASLGLNFHWEKVKLALSGDYQSKIYTEDDNSDEAQDVPGGFDSNFVVNAKVTYNLAKYADLSLSVNNVFDEEYYQYYKAPGRSALAELTLKF